jgi:essential nuclear protein 1
MIPALPQWARILALTNPTAWTPHATKAATRILISNLKPAQARVYLEGVLLERVRTNMQETHQGRKLDVQLFDALKKALYKPGAFFKGILFPLVQVRTRGQLCL